MINSLLYARRQFAWNWRLAASTCRLEYDGGGRVALWVFDTLRGPDGYALRNHMHELAKREGLRLYAFGPYAGSRAAGRLFQSATTFEAGLAAKLRSEADKLGARLYLTGSTKGRFASAIGDGKEVWEMQHGLLDPSYLPLGADRFFVRSTSSMKILANAGFSDRLQEFSQDLSPPTVTAVQAMSSDILVCYSKNPGGGCTAKELADFEMAAIEFSERTGRPLIILPHPRDNRAKMAARHRGGRIFRYIGSIDNSRDARKLIISSYSTALTSNSVPGDLLLNVSMNVAHPVVQAEYSWLPTVSVNDLKSLNLADLPAVKRL